MTQRVKITYNYLYQPSNTISFFGVVETETYILEKKNDKTTENIIHWNKIKMLLCNVLIGPVSPYHIDKKNIIKPY